MNVKEFWRSFNIRCALEHIAAAWDEVKPQTMNAVWRKLWPEVVLNFGGFDPIPRQEALQAEIATLANASHLAAEGEEELNAADIAELVASHTDDLTAEELVELQREKREGEAQEEEESPLPKATTYTGLMEMVQLFLGLMDGVLANDGDADRSFRVRNAIKELMRPYEEALRQRRLKARQTDITTFLPPAKKARTASPPPAAASP